MEKEFEIRKFSDLKDKNFREYIFFRKLQVDEEGFPTTQNLEEIVALENENNNVAFFIGEDKITMLSFKNPYRFNKNVILEYKKNCYKSAFSKIYLASSEKLIETIKLELDFIEKNYENNLDSETNRQQQDNNFSDGNCIRKRIR